MSKSRKLLIVVLIVFTAIGIFIYHKYTKVNDYSENIETYAELLKEDPKNCFYNEQMAINYSFLNRFYEAIRYYEIAIDNCPESLINLFQLGVTHYLEGNKSLGLKFMDKAIEKAKLANDSELELMFKKEKSDWTSKGK